MTRRTRVALAVIGLVLVLFSLAALTYSLAPINPLRESTAIAPTLFTLPPGGIP